MIKHLFFFILLLQILCPCYSQDLFVDSLKITAGITATAASEDYQPLWAVSNRFGAIEDRKADLSTFVGMHNRHVLGRKLDLSYGFDLYNNQEFKRVFLQQAYAKLNYGRWQLRAGRFREVIGEVDADLSTGSLGVSGNALPIPKVGFILNEYTDFPFTKGWLKVKGLISHGWMGKDQYMKDAYLHEKALYLRAGRKRFKVYGGIQHYAVWGGRRDDWISLDRSFKGFMNVLLVKEADDGSVDYGDSVKTSRPNRAGDHRGVIEAGVEYEFDAVKLNVYNQTPFDTGQGIDIRNIDRLFGLSLTNKGGSFWKKVLAEFIYTKQMNNFYSSRFRESYYNNGVYKTGWEYEDRIIGTPLFINRTRGSHYFEEIEPYDWDAPNNTIGPNSNIINNQVVGGHLGALYNIGHLLAARTMLTYTRNVGGNKVMKPHKDQCYTFQEVSYRLRSANTLLTAGVGYDFGDLSNNFGMQLGIRYSLMGNAR